MGGGDRRDWPPVFWGSLTWGGGGRWGQGQGLPRASGLLGRWRNRLQVQIPAPRWVTLERGQPSHTAGRALMGVSPTPREGPGWAPAWEEAGQCRRAWLWVCQVGSGSAEAGAQVVKGAVSGHHRLPVPGHWAWSQASLAQTGPGRELKSRLSTGPCLVPSGFPQKPHGVLTYLTGLETQEVPTGLAIPGAAPLLPHGPDAGIPWPRKGGWRGDSEPPSL